jgi:mono/diheme cytochrome c family protein
MLKQSLIGLAGAFVLGLLIFVALAWRSSIAPIEPPAAASFPPDLVAKGEALAGAGNCASCHTAKDGQPFAGGYGLVTSFGTVYSSNITPDPETGIGRWSEAAFARALHEGVARSGKHLFPTFPYDHFTKIDSDDTKALYAFLMTRTPVRSEAKPNTLPFPLNIRMLQEGWKILFFRKGVFEPVAGKSDEWNRGAYLAEGLGHCGACHTPRNGLGAEKKSKTYAGATIDGWIAPALTDASTSPVAWSEAELFAYLRSGASALHGTAAGSMSDVVHDGLSKLPDADIKALAVYLADINGSSAKLAGTDAAMQKAVATSGLGFTNEPDPDARLYASACGSCHYNSGPQPLAARPELALNSALTLPEPTNFIQVVLKGVGLGEGMPNVMMPGFEKALSDDDVARLAVYLRRTRTDLPPWTDVESKVAAIRAQASAAP